MKKIEAQDRSSAVDASLRYVTDDTPGIRRRLLKSGVRYTGPDGTAIRDKAVLARIWALAIPPAYTDVWICPLAHGHLQATGRDARGRKQYRYHARWREVRDAEKYGSIVEFGRALPTIRKGVARHLRLKGLPREKVLAAIVSLLEQTLIRVGKRRIRPGQWLFRIDDAPRSPCVNFRGDDSFSLQRQERGECRHDPARQTARRRSETLPRSPRSRIVPIHR